MSHTLALLGQAPGLDRYAALSVTLPANRCLGVHIEQTNVGDRMLLIVLGEGGARRCQIRDDFVALASMNLFDTKNEKIIAISD